jgi:hypothetical protein
VSTRRGSPHTTNLYVLHADADANEPLVRVRIARAALFHQTLHATEARRRDEVADGVGERDRELLRRKLRRATHEQVRPNIRGARRRTRMEKVAFQPPSIWALGSQPRASAPWSDACHVWMTMPPGTPSYVWPLGVLATRASHCARTVAFCDCRATRR